MQIVRGDKEEAWLRAIVQPVKNSTGNIERFSVYASDLTRTIEASCEHQNLIVALQRSTAVIEFDLSGTVLTANERFLKSMGYSLDQIVGKHHQTAHHNIQMTLPKEAVLSYKKPCKSCANWQCKWKRRQRE